MQKLALALAMASLLAASAHAADAPSTFPKYIWQVVESMFI